MGIKKLGSQWPETTGNGGRLYGSQGPQWTVDLDKKNNFYASSQETVTASLLSQTTGGEICNIC